MIIEFENDYLRELYEDGKAKNKKYRFQPSVIKQYKNTVDKLKAARQIEDLFFFSKIVGDTPEVFTICLLTELSKHYE